MATARPPGRVQPGPAPVSIWHRLGTALGALGGATGGHFFGVPPAYVDPRKAPGFSPFPPPTLGGWVRDSATLKTLLFTPNLVWLGLAAAVYAAFPYDLSRTGIAAAAPVSAAFFAQRLPLWAAFILG